MLCFVSRFFEGEAVVGAVSNCGKAGAFFAEAFPSTLWKSSKDNAEGLRFSISIRCGSFHSAPRSSFFGKRPERA